MKLDLKQRYTHAAPSLIFLTDTIEKGANAVGPKNRKGWGLVLRDNT